MRKVSILSIAAALALLGGCAPKTWHRDGATQEEFYMGQGLCKAQAFGITGATVMQVAIVFNSCMQGHGWYLARD